MLSFISIINLINIIVTWFSLNCTKILFNYSNSNFFVCKFLMILVATKFENFSHKELLPSNEELKGNEILFRNDQKIFDLVKIIDRHSDSI